MGEETRAARQKRLLGTSFGAAASKLRKSLLFHLAGKCGLLICHHCNDAIDLIDEFSIEHKEPWEWSDSPELKFFDLKNIAFSHLRCNVAAARKPNKKYATIQEYRRVNFAKFYAKHGEQLKARRNQKRRSQRSKNNGV